MRRPIRAKPDSDICVGLHSTPTLQTRQLHAVNPFYARQMYRQVLLRARISYGNSVCPCVCLSVCPGVTTRYRINPRWDRDSGFSPYGSLGPLVSNEVIWCRWVRRFPSNEGIKEGHPPPLRNRNFTTIGSSSVWTVADRHRLAAYHNKHCWRAFRGYQHRWPWTTLNPQNRGFSEFLLMLSRVSWALAQISCQCSGAD